MDNARAYEATRQAEIKRIMRHHVREFAARHDPARDTILLIPGTSGSQLDRSALAHDAPGWREPPDYDAVWLDPGVLISDIRHLAIEPDGKDVGGHIIVPNGPLDFTYFFSPYDYTQGFFNRNGFNFVVFGYDWRRPLDEAAALLEFFIEALTKAIARLHGANGDRRMTMVCHSMGGLVALLFLQRLGARSGADASDGAKWLHRVVTVGTPFYGTASPLKYYYGGLAELNWRYGADIVTRVVATFPGPALLQFLDRRSYEDYVRAFMQRGEAPEMSRYPCRDADDPNACEIDPFGDETLRRYPSWIYPQHLQRALQLRRLLHERLPETLLGRLFHIRVACHPTCDEIHWHAVDAAAYCADGPLPFEPRDGRGDRTVPYWSARYCHTPIEHVCDIDTPTEHSELMEDDAVLAAIHHLARDGVFPQTEMRGRLNASQPQAAPVHAVRALAVDEAHGRVARDDAHRRNPAVWRRVLQELGFD